MKQQDEFTPLAESLRPQKLSEVIGQKHLLAKDKFLHNILSNKKPVSMILWGPPGSGKTTIARIIGHNKDYEYTEISAVTSGLSDVKCVIIDAKAMQRLGKKTVLFVDEIHRFNKAQQDAFLPHVENGTIVLIGATTENPSFEVISPLLSRTRVVVLESLTKKDITTLLKRAQKHIAPKSLNKDSLALLAELSGGDARMAINGLELAAQLSPKEITTERVKQAMLTAGKQTAKYDKGGEYHYNIISAYIKSMRGGDIDATLYYLARMINGGEDPKFIARRNIVFASEDIGLAAPAALNLAVSTFLTVERVGSPECNYALFECAIVLAKSKKSRAVTDAMNNAFDIASKNPDAAVPLHLRNAPTKLMKDLGYQKGTKWESGFKHSNGFMPSELKDIDIF